MVAEFKKVLHYPRLAKHDIDIRQAVKFIETTGTTYTLQYPVKCYLRDDENDDYLIALALQTYSGFITSGDEDILSQKANLEKKYKKLKILTKAEFEEMFG
jgi:predicted nucleic acid-binding protein